MASRNKDERKLVNELVKYLMIETQKLYVYIDRDCGKLRNTSSGWDFHMSLNSSDIYCEAKIEKKKLSDWQILTQARIKNAGSPYRVIRFWDGGEFFTIDDGKMIAISDAKFNDFL